MLSVGETLRRARQEQGLDLCTVAARTKISERYLEAIESNDRKLLPSGFFYKSFVDQYAKSLSLDTREIDAEINRVLSADEPLPLPGFGSVVARDVTPMALTYRFPRRRWIAPAASLLLVLAACSGVYAWWHDVRSSLSVHGLLDNVRAFTKPKVAIASSKAANPKVEEPAPQPVAITAPPQQSVTESAAVPVSPAPETKSPVPETKPDDAAESDSLSASTGYKVMLDVIAREATWLSLSSDGKPVFSGVLQPNETKTVGGKQFAKMRVGNAAGLEVRLNGKPLGPLGARGQVLIVLFTPDNFQIVSPAKESD
jgi:cytoskeleton protein RodZ